MTAEDDGSRDAVTSIYYCAEFSSMLLSNSELKPYVSSKERGGEAISHLTQTASVSTLTHVLHYRPSAPGNSREVDGRNNDLITLILFIFQER